MSNFKIQGVKAPLLLHSDAHGTMFYFLGRILVVLWTELQPIYIHNHQTENNALRDEGSTKRRTEFYDAMNKHMLRIFC